MVYDWQRIGYENDFFVWDTRDQMIEVDNNGIATTSHSTSHASSSNNAI